MKRGDIVIVSGRDYAGKPRPALIVQNDTTLATHPSITLCPITTVRSGFDRFRVEILADAENGLKEISEIEVDRVVSVPRRKIAERIGKLPTNQLARVDEILRRWLVL